MGDGFGVLRRVQAVDRSLVAGKLDEDIALARIAGADLEGSAAHDEASLVLCEGDPIGAQVLLVAIGIMHVDPRDPVTLHGCSPSNPSTTTNSPVLPLTRCSRAAWYSGELK